MGRECENRPIVITRIGIVIAKIAMVIARS